MAKRLSPRQIARQLAVQTLYAWQVSGNALEAEAAHMVALREGQSYDSEYLKQVLLGMEQVRNLDQLMTPFLSRRLEQVSPIELAVLRLSVWELEQRLDIPYRVVINEGIELSKLFGAQDSHKFINGVLDQVSKVVRREERR